MPSAFTSEIARSRITQVFRYLEALDQLRNPVTRQVQDQPWRLWLREIPDHETIRLEIPTTNGNDEAGEFALTVGRAERHAPPPPPSEIKVWLERGWDDPSGEASVRKTRNVADRDGNTETVRFDEDPSRVRRFREWRVERAAWAEAERPARAARALFERIYALYGDLEREGEKLELVLGDGLLNWRVPEGGVNHPVLLQRLRLSFDPKKPEFTISEADHEPELYSALFRVLPGVDAAMIAERRSELSAASFHPLGDHDTAGFFRALVNPMGSGKGVYVGDAEIRGEEDHPRLGRAPVLFVRSRTLGFASAIEKILERIPDDDELPVSLVDIVGGERPGSASTTEAGDESGSRRSDEVEILLSKAANKEQLQIAERLEQRRAVIVQGPPGTGKTHTIANLLGHLLAQGKSVLVTSHTEKALERVREQVVEPLRSLCVSVLGAHAEGRQALQDAVASISDRLGDSPDTLEREAAALSDRRRQLQHQQRELEEHLLSARRSEYDAVVIGGRAFSPSDAARHVDKHSEVDGWIPTPVELGAPLPLSEEDVLSLYRTNVALSDDDERELQGALPDPKELPGPDTFAKTLNEIDDLRSLSTQEYNELWTRSHEPKEADRLRKLADEVAKAASVLAGEDWVLEAIEAGRISGPRLDLWKKLAEQIRAVDRAGAGAEEAIVSFDPSLAPDSDLVDQEACLAEIVEHLSVGKSLNFFWLFRHPEWKRLVESARVQGRPPERLEEFSALWSLARLELDREALRRRWERMVSARGGLPADGLGPHPERKLRLFAAEIDRYVGWFSGEWSALSERFAEHGLDWEALLASTPFEPDEYAELRRMGQAAARLRKIVDARINEVRRKDLERQVNALLRALNTLGEEATGSIVRDLAEAVRLVDEGRYKTSHDKLVRVFGLRDSYRTRCRLLAKVTEAAPAWANALRDREPPHDVAEPPGSAADAWLWRQLHDILEDRAKTDVEELQRQLERVKDDLMRVTSDLIERRAWAHQIRHVERNSRQRQALKGWAQMMRRIGAGTGKRAPRLRREARELMKECRGAVPVWVMPLAGLVDSFDPLDTRFDVVIIDEASQLDVMGLIALYMAREVVVVGDHEQVSPAAVGQNIDDTEYLIREHLEGIPLAALYDGKKSLYDLAEHSFGRPIPLVEHFRCVPDIIAFSNALCYNFRIKPLRDAAQVALRPHVVPHRVSGTRSDGKTNEAEAYEIASLIAAATEHPAYDGATFGVISLLGAEQAKLIQNLLEAHLTPLTIANRHIRCGDSAHFQGDERDVMFLSVVDSPQDGPLRMRKSTMLKQRLNVAASRARDQMWVVHSLNPATDLKPEDLRKRLIDHACDPRALVELAQSGEARTESEFEKRVLQRLVAAGYRVVPQWEVGAYRIDLVVVGPDGGKLAVECDGDRYHPPEKLPDDMARQAILERLGWRFSRIRGSVFFRDPDAAMEPVFARLSELGIAPDAHQDLSETTDSDEAIVEAVIRRAAELRREWQDDAMLGTRPVEPDEEPRGGSPLSSESNGSETSQETSRPPRADATTSPPGVTVGGGNGEARYREQPDLFAQSPAPPTSNTSVKGSGGTPSPEGELFVGIRVRHSVFGLGHVLELHGSGDRETAVIRFHKHGDKKLKVRLAGLRIVDG